MKKYIVSFLVASVFLLGAPFAIQQVSASDMSIKDFINLLVTIGVITPDKMPAVNTFLASLDNKAPTIQPSVITSLSASSATQGMTVTVYGSNFYYSTSTSNQIVFLNPAYSGSVVGKTSSNGSSITFVVPDLSQVSAGNYSIMVENTLGQQSNTIPFNVVAQSPSSRSSITVLSPNGGEFLTIGQTYNITWKAKSTGNVQIRLEDNSGGSTEVISPVISASSGSYSWKLSDSSFIHNSSAILRPGTRYNINIFDDVHSFDNDNSDNYFTISM